MTNVLRKKISMSTGMPPSITNATGFWDNLQAAMEAWLLKGLEVTSEVRISSRKIVLGEGINSSVGGESVSYSFKPLVGNGLSHIAISHELAVKFAAHLMQQDPASFGEVSDLFLSLITEDPAMLLREGIKAYLSDGRFDFENGVGINLELSHEDLLPAMRYVQVTLDCTLCDLKGQVSLFFDLNKLKNYIAEQATASVVGLNSSKLNEHGVIGTSVHQSDVPVHAILERMEMRFGDCSRFHIGQVLPLLKANKDEIMVAVDTVSGSIDISKGRLGLWKNKRAVKLSVPVSEGFVRDLVGF